MYNLEDGLKHICTYRVGSQDTTGDGYIRPERLIALLQETGDSHLRTFGKDYMTMHNEEHLAFVITRMTIEFLGDIRIYDEIKIRTWFDKAKSVNFPRCFDAFVGDKLVLRAYSNWGLIDLDKNRFVKFQDFVYSKGPFEPLLELGIPERFKIPSDVELVYDHSFAVRFSMTDANRHMNNVMYVDPMWDAIPNIENLIVEAISIRYIHETLCGEEMNVYRSDIIEENGDKVIYFRLISNDVIRAEGRWIVADK